jgi:hypothetical protein
VIHSPAHRVQVLKFFLVIVSFVFLLFVSYSYNILRTPIFTMSASQSLPKDPAAHQKSSSDNKDDTRKDIIMAGPPWYVSNDTSLDSKQRHVTVSTFNFLRYTS